MKQCYISGLGLEIHTTQSQYIYGSVGDKELKPQVFMYNTLLLSCPDLIFD